MNVVLIDEHPFVLNITSNLLEDLFHELHITRCSNLPDALFHLAEHPADAIISELDLQDFDQEQVVEALAAAAGHAKLIFLSKVDISGNLKAQLQAHQWVFVPKNQTYRTISHILADSLGLQDKIDLLQSKIRKGLEKAVNKGALTGEQYAVMKALSQGLDAEHIGIRLGCTKASAESLIDEAFVQLGVRNKDEALIAFRKLNRFLEKLQG